MSVSYEFLEARVLKKAYEGLLGRILGDRGLRRLAGERVDPVVVHLEEVQNDLGAVPLFCLVSHSFSLING